MDLQQEINELLPLRLNAEPSIFRGCSLSELMLLVTVGGIVLVPGSVIVCGLFGYLMMGVGIGLLLVIAWVVIGATVLQKLKRGKPLGFYQLRLRLWLEDLDFPDFARHQKELKCNSNRGVYEQRQAIYRRV